jgi:hypothetical protein
MNIATTIVAILIPAAAFILAAEWAIRKRPPWA